MTDIFEALESSVRSYCRSFPVVFKHAQGSCLYDEQDRRYIDFLSGGGSLNYGHNHPVIKERLIHYLNNNGIVMGLDMFTTAKKEFLETFHQSILMPRGMDYKIQFTGPTGTNAVEAAFKLARKVTGRSGIISFTNGFHGMTLGSVSATGNAYYRKAVGTPLNNVAFMPYDGYMGPDADTTEYIRKCLTDSSSGMDLPAAMIVETVQSEGGVNVGNYEWLRSLEKLCRDFDILLIVDDIQVGCGRTGSFFSFEDVGISPDMILLSKSLSGFGLPLSIVLLKPELDQWKPGEHNGTFRGNNAAFVTATQMIHSYWRNNELSLFIGHKSDVLKNAVDQMVSNHPGSSFESRGRGLIWGIDMKEGNLAKAAGRKAFEKGVIIETCGSQNHILKFLPPLLMGEDLLQEGLQIVSQCIDEVVSEDTKQFRKYGFKALR